MPMTIAIRKLIFFKKHFIYSWETQTERQRLRQREKQASCWEPDARLSLRTLGSRPEPKADAQPLNHPGAPSCDILWEFWKSDNHSPLLGLLFLIVFIISVSFLTAFMEERIFWGHYYSAIPADITQWWCFEVEYVKTFNLCYWTQKGSEVS